MKSNRIRWVDQCKGIGIILVVLGHCLSSLYSFQGACIQWIGSFHMPLFFIISGYLLACKRKTLPNDRIEANRRIIPFFVQKAERLLVPAFFFCMIDTLYFSLIEYLSGGEWLEYAKKALYEILTLRFDNAKWFLPCLLLAESIVFYETIVIQNKKIGMSIWAFLTLVGLAFPNTRGFPAILLRACVAQCFLIVGSVFRNSIEVRMSKRSMIVFGPLLFVLGFIGTILNGNSAIAVLEFGSSRMLFLANGITTSFGMILMLKYIDKPFPVLEWFGTHSIVVLCTHMVFINMFWILNTKVLHFSFWNGWIVSVCVLLVEIPVVLFCERYLPIVCGLRGTKSAK